MAASPTTRSYRLPGGAGKCNALRRALLTDLSCVAPDAVVVRTNTTGYTDEYLAARIGLVPFDVTDDETTTTTLCVTGPCTATTADLVGARHATIELARCRAGQSLDLDVHFRRGTGREHARFTRVAAVGMAPVDDDDLHELRFDPLYDDAGHACLHEALAALQRRIDGVRAQLRSSCEDGTR